MNYSDFDDIMLSEGETEIFVDLIRDLELEKLSKGETKDYGTYKNHFNCVDVLEDTEGDKDENWKYHIIEAKFYEIGSTIKLVLHTWGDDKDIDSIFWIDEANGSSSPEEHPEWHEIRENMDIFLDDE